MEKLIAAAVAVVGTFCLFANEVTFTGAAATSSDYTTKGSMLLVASNWSDGEPVSETNDYTIAKTFSVGGGLVFNGKSLTITSGSMYFAAASANVTFANEGLVFNGGSIINGNNLASQANWTINGNVTFKANTTFNPYRSTSKHTFTGPKISASAGKTVTLTSTGSARKSTLSGQSWHYRFLGDMSEFYGTLQVGGGNTAGYLSYALIGADDFAGTVHVMGGANATSSDLGNGVFAPCSTNQAGAVVEHVGEVTVPTLKIESTGSLAVSGGDTNRQNYGTITVTSSFTALGKVNFFITDVPKYVTEPYRIPVLRAPLGSDLEDVDFVLRWNGAAKSPNGAASLSVEKTATQEILYLNYEKYSLHTSTGESASSNSTSAGKFFTFWQWPDTSTPGYLNDVVYASGGRVVYGGGSGSIRLCDARKLTLTGGDILFSGNVDCPRVELHDDGHLTMYNNKNLSVTGDVAVVGSGYVSTYQASSYAGKTLTYTGKWTGTGAFTFSGGGIYHALKNDMTDFFGRITVSGSSAAYHAKVRIKDATSFGRPVDGAAFAYNALAFNTEGEIFVTNTITTASDARGVYFSAAGGTINVASNQVFTHTGALTLAGVMRKDGGGTYVQGGELAFLSKRDPTPLADTNVVQVLGGAVGVLNADAFNGAAITLSEGASLGVDVATTDDGVATYGLRNTKWATPLVTEAASGKIGVSLYTSNPSAERKCERTLAVCTLDSAVAAGLSFEYVGARKVGGYRFDSFSTRDNGDGTTTVMVNLIGSQGLILFVR